MGSSLKYALLTLTVKRCSTEEVEQTCKLLEDGLKKFVQMDRIRSLFLKSCFLEQSFSGSLALDVQCSLHFHCIVELIGKRPSLSVIRECWQRACDLDYAPVIDFRSLSGYFVQPYPSAC